MVRNILTNKPIKLIKNGEVINDEWRRFDNFIYNVINSQKENNTERIVEEVLKKA